MKKSNFSQRAQEILDLKIAFQVNELGGYGADGEIIYNQHPRSCPSVLVENQDNVTATFMSNGSLDLMFKRDDGMEINVLRGHFDQFEKREIGVPSNNVWFSLDGKDEHIASLINPKQNMNAAPQWIKLVKLGDPERAYWYCAGFNPAPGISFETAVRHTLVMTKQGPAVARQMYVRNTGKKKLKGSLWPFFDLRGKQLFVYNKEIWYDMGMPLNNKETVITATLPYSTIMQIKRISSKASGGIKAGAATCDYLSFIGDSASYTLIPDAVRGGGLLDQGAGKKFNRFSTATIYAQEFKVDLARGASGAVEQSLLYIGNDKTAESYRKKMQSKLPTYKDMTVCYKRAAEALIKKTKGADEIGAMAAKTVTASKAHPDFDIRMPAQLAVQEYANSVWTGVEELYENCRAHGAKMAQGIEIGTRDRGQDMWPKLKENPGRVRKDLVHLFSFMYYHTDADLDKKKGRFTTLKEKLHGTFPRQYPSRWDDRSEEVPNDNRPYSDSALWPIDSVIRYIEETGDTSILLERVKTVKLVDPENPINSTMVGHDKEFYIAEIMFEILAAFERHAKESPYGLVQSLYGDWCDPIDMFGTDPMGDPNSRGRGRGGNTRLAAHAFVNAVKTSDLFSIPAVHKLVKAKVKNLDARIAKIQKFADAQRKAVVKWAWEVDGFIDYLSEYRKDGKPAKVSKGEIGYTLGSIKGHDYDGLKRRGLVAQAWCMMMLLADRDWLTPVKERDGKIKTLLAMVEKVFYDKVLGLKLFTPPLANNEDALTYIGRIGIVPAGTAENGEYHHGQTMMHLFRLEAFTNQADSVWKQFKPIMSATRGLDLNGPFEMPSTSYASDKADPHFGAGMYFGLSGSTDWIVNIFEKIAGLHLNLHDPALPALQVIPKLPKDIQEELTFKRFIHYALKGGGYRKIPFTLNIDHTGTPGTKLKETRIKINGKKADKAEIADLAGMKKVTVDITYIH